MFLAFDYYVTESSGHNSEYNAWFRKRPDLIEKYCTHGTGWNPGRSRRTSSTSYMAREDDWKRLDRGLVRRAGQPAARARVRGLHHQRA